MNKENIALVIGGTGSIGSAIINELKNQNFTNIISLSRSSNPPLDLLDESSIEKAADFIKNQQKSSKPNKSKHPTNLEPFKNKNLQKKQSKNINTTKKTSKSTQNKT